MNDELMHFGVKGMKWGIRKYLPAYFQKTGLERVRDRYKRKASIQYMKSRLAATKASNARLKPINPWYYYQKDRYERKKARYEKSKAMKEAAQKLIDKNDPIGDFLNKSEKKIDRGVEWVVKNDKLLKQPVENLRDRLRGDQSA